MTQVVQQLRIALSMKTHWICASWPFEMRLKTDLAPWILCYFLSMWHVRKFKHLINLKCIVTL